MTPLVTITSRAVPILGDNIDTDIIIPSREMRSVTKTGLADGLFAGWRYTTIGGREPNPQFALNQSRYTGAAILLSGANFGCGSSREHAVWALAEYGFRVVIAQSFSPIFEGNCIRNGIAPLIFEKDEIAEMAVAAEQGAQFDVDLPAKSVVVGELAFGFELGPEPLEMLTTGADAIEMTSKRLEAIQTFRQNDRVLRPWAYLD